VKLALQYLERVLTNGANADNGTVKPSCPDVQLLVRLTFAGNPVFHQGRPQVCMLTLPRNQYRSKVENSDSVGLPDKSFSLTGRANSAGVAHCNAEWGRI